MPLTRRAFLELVGSGTAYAFTYGCDVGFVEVPVETRGQIGPNDHAVEHFVDGAHEHRHAPAV